MGGLIYVDMSLIPAVEGEAGWQVPDNYMLNAVFHAMLGNILNLL